MDFLWSGPLQSKESQQIVRGALIDPQGVPRVKVGKILSWAYRYSGSDFRAWGQYVDAKLSKKGLGSDARAAWLMIEAHRRAISLDPANPARGLPLLQQALISARSEPSRLAVVDELTAYFEQARRPDLAVSLIKSVRSQFPEQALTRLDGIAKRAGLAHQVNQSREATNRSRNEHGRKSGLARYYRMMLARAERRKDQVAVRQFQTAIGKLYK